jgi:hypothetical protein
MASIRTSCCRSSSSSMCRSSQAKNPASWISPYLMISAAPARSSRNGNVRRVSVSMSTARGWWKAPIMFLPSGWLTPVLPPTDESTWESRVVGTWMKSMPRW